MYAFINHGSGTSILFENLVNAAAMNLMFTENYEVILCHIFFTFLCIYFSHNKLCFLMMLVQ